MILATSSFVWEKEKAQKAEKEEKLVAEISLDALGVTGSPDESAAQNKIAEKKSGSTHWEPRVKIGVTLLLIGIVLSVFGLGLIGGISAFIGLLFTILGLLNTYY